MSSFNSGFICNVLCQVILFFVFISVFFFTYAALTEQRTVQNQLNFLVDETISPYLKLLCNIDPNGLCKTLKDKINNLKPDTSADASVESNNKQVIIKTIIVLGIAIVTVLGIISLIWFISKQKNSGFFTAFNMKPIIIESLIILAFVALTEFIFLTYFGARFISIDVNKIKIALLTKLKAFFSQ